MRHGITGFVAALAVLTHAGTAGANEVETFYRGKQISILVGAAAGGVYDVTARAVARHLGKHIPGNPTIVVQNLPAAGGLHLANQLVNVSPQDGTVIALANNALPSSPYLRPDNARFDPASFSWIGSSGRDLQVVAAWHTSGIRTMDDLFSKDFVVGAISRGTALVDFPLLANALTGTRFKIVAGYSGVPAVMLAIERGEVQGNGGLGWVQAKAQFAGMLKDDKLKVIAQYGFKPAPDLTRVPLIPTGKTEADRQAFELLYSRLDYGRPFFGPPNVPADRLAALRGALADTLKDPEFRKDADRVQLTIEHVSGEELAEITRRLAATPPAVSTRVRAILEGSLQSK
jgi:tripartite-type tricarboxylate transporter receptor subunit TctC